MHFVVGDGLTALLVMRLSGQGRILIRSGQQLPEVRTSEIRYDLPPATLVPVLPVLGPNLLNRRLAEQSTLFGRIVNEEYEALLVEHVAPELVNPKLESRYLNGSFGAWAESLSERTLALSEKQYGACVEEAMSQVRNKIHRSYFGGEPASLRTGYSDGLSPYALLAEETLGACRQIVANPSRIDIHRRMLEFVDRPPIRYSSIIYTGNVLKLFDLVGAARPVLKYAPATFRAGQCSTNVRSNRIVYDARSQSSVFRVILPRPGVWVAQMSNTGAQADAWEDSKLMSDVAQLLDSKVSVASRSLTLQKAYPTETLPPEIARRLDSLNAESGVRAFGRYAQWRYVDLHELDWNCIDAT